MGLVQPDGLHRKFATKWMAMRERYYNSRFSGLGFSRVIDGFYCVCLWVALPLAVFTSNGWLGLLSHGLVLTGAASFLNRPFSKSLTSSQDR